MMTNFHRRFRRFAMGEYPQPFLSMQDTIDTMESYVSGSNVSGLNNTGSGWYTPYRDDWGAYGVGWYDDMESYTSSSNLDGQNSARSFFIQQTASYVDR